jgi:parallel beta-helix repeat protein
VLRTQRWTTALGVVGGSAILALGAGVLPVQAAGTQRYVSPFGADTSTCSSAAAPCETVTYAVGQSTAGDTINLAAGAYVEQVAITESLSIVGAGQDDTTIQAPAAPLTADAQSQTYIVAISGGSSAVATMSKLTIAGPGPTGGGCGAGDPNGLDKGITVFGGASLSLSSAAVRNVYNQPNLGCQKGDAISIGSPCFSCSADVGHATLTSVKISVYQKNGIAVRGIGSTLQMSKSIVTNNASSQIASNGIEVVNGAVAVVSRTTVTGNECNVPAACGPDPFDPSTTSGSGILLSQSGAGTSFKSNTVSGNDIGIYTDDGVTLSHNNANNNRYVGIFVDVDAAHGMFTYNTATSTTAGADEYGIITQSGQSNHFSHDTAQGNSIFDMDAANIAGSDTNVTANNACTLASPSKAYWHCP